MFYDTWLYKFYQYSWLYNLRWKVTHWFYKEHWVHCDLTCNYHDKMKLMESALFTLVEDFVAKNKEDAFKHVYVEDDVREKIIQIIHFYRIESVELQKKIDEKLHELYGKNKLCFKEKNEKGLCEAVFIDNSGFSEIEKKKKRNELQQIEKELFNKTQEYLKLCIDVRPHLWS